MIGDGMSKEITNAIEKGQRVIDRWNSPDWKHTGELIRELEQALKGLQELKDKYKAIEHKPDVEIDQHHFPVWVCEIMELLADAVKE